MKSVNAKIKAVSAIGLSLALQAAFAGNITDINVSTLPNNQRIVKIKFDKDVVAPSGFVTTTPARISLDFPGTGAQVAQPTLRYDDTVLNQITVAQNADRTRVLLNLAKNGQYNTEVKGNEVWVYVSEAVNQTQAVSAKPVVKVEKNAATMGANLDFRKGNNGSGVVDIVAPGFDGEPSVKKQADRVTITLKNYPLPIKSQRSLDVSDFNTPVRTATMRRIGNDTQITIKNHGSWDIKTQSSGSRLSFEVVPKATVEIPGFKAEKKSFSGRKVSLDFQDVDVRVILQILAKESGMNIVASDSVSGKMTLTLKDVPWDQALDLVMQARNLDMRRQGNIINVAPREELLAQDKATLQAQNEVDQLSPLYSQTFQLKYKSVNEFKDVLNSSTSGSGTSTGSSSNGLLSSRGSVLIDPATNTLIVTDNPNVLKKFQRLIDELDVPARQVMVEARIVEASDTFSRALGIKFGYNRDGKQNDFKMDNVTMPALAATTTLSLVRSLNTSALNLELQAQQTQGNSKIISSPRVLTQDSKTATIESGTEIPYQEASSSGATSTSFKKAVLGLTVTPHITPDGQVIMDISVNKDSVDKNCGATEPCIATKSLKTNAMVEDGGTLILGGIYEEDNSEGTTKVPVLGDLPLVGNLFKSRSKSNERRELLIFITPRIMGQVGSNLRY